MIQDKLLNMGYKVFFDVESLRNGKFNIKLYSVIDECKDLAALDISGFDTSNVTETKSMFKNCDSLKELDVSNFSPELVENMDITP